MMIMSQFEVAEEDRDLAGLHAAQVAEVQDWAAFTAALEPEPEGPSEQPEARA